MLTLRFTEKVMQKSFTTFSRNPHTRLAEVGNPPCGSFEFSGGIDRSRPFPDIRLKQRRRPPMPLRGDCRW